MSSCHAAGLRHHGEACVGPHPNTCHSSCMCHSPCTLCTHTCGNCRREALSAPVHTSHLSRKPHLPSSQKLQSSAHLSGCFWWCLGLWRCIWRRLGWCFWCCLEKNEIAFAGRGAGRGAWASGAAAGAALGGASDGALGGASGVACEAPLGAAVPAPAGGSVTKLTCSGIGKLLTIF